MSRTLLVAAICSFAPALASAQSWSGYLVDSNCYQFEKRNVNPTDTTPDGDPTMDVRYCRPTAKTKSFIFVSQDGRSFQLDPAGNADAAKIVQNSGKTEFVPVTVAGQQNRKTITVTSISPRK